MLPHGDAGYEMDVQNRRDTADEMTLLQHGRYRLYTRHGQHYVPHSFGALFQQWVVDHWSLIDQERADYIKSKEGQKKIRADSYKTVEAAVDSGQAEGRNLGGRIILPATHVGSRRYMNKAYHHSMAVVRSRGRPTLFITFTANPKWPEIERELWPGQDAKDRPDLVSRVFALKVESLLHEVRHNNVFGRCTGLVYTIEYQKRGLPHLHLLLFLSPDDRRRYTDPSDIDHVVCAEFPSAEMDPTGDLGRTVASHMLHSACGPNFTDAPCWKEGRCSKHFLKPFLDETAADGDSYPLYRRRRGPPVVKYAKGRPYAYYNDRVVPYNPYLLKKFDCHLNVEICSSIQAVKYLHKYIYKGPDIVTVRIAQRNPELQNDEVLQYFSCRYIGPIEGAWRMLGFRTNEQYPPVISLAVHAPDDQRIQYEETENQEQLADRLRLSRSHLTAFFELNDQDPSARDCLFGDLPSRYTWNAHAKVWKPRKRGVQIGHMSWAHPASGERYFVRLLLTVVRGARSWDELRSFEGELYPSFKLACEARGLLHNDGYWEHALAEAGEIASGRQLRSLFVMGVTMDSVTNPVRLWELYCNTLCDDLLRRLPEQFRYPPDMVDPHLDYGLYLIRESIHAAGGQFSAVLDDLPTVRFDWAGGVTNRLIREECSFNTAEEEADRDRVVPSFNEGQRRAFDTIVSGIADAPLDGDPPVFFLHGPGGTGKTYLYRGICHYFRSRGKIVLCVASSGIAALLLPGGRTAHSRFKIPIDLTDESLCNMQRGTTLSALLQATSLIIWDEVPMQDRWAVEAVSKTLADVCERLDGTGGGRAFGGIPVLFGGDFAQTLPIKPDGGRPQAVMASLTQSTIWAMARVLYLTDNMRVSGADDENRSFVSWLQDLSYDKRLHGDINLPSYMPTAASLTQLYDEVFPATFMQQAATDIDAFRGRVILCIQNAVAAEHNAAILDRLPGAVREYASVNSLPPDDDNTANGGDDSFRPSEEVLQTLKSSNLPPAILRLKEGMPIMALRNLNPSAGVCNGTRFAMTGLFRNTIRGRVLGGDFHGTEHFLPRIMLYSDEKKDGIRFCRSQFPVRPCFAMTINKSQGQSFEKVGVDLRREVFSHGQFYVAMSRVTNVRNITMLCSEAGGRAVRNVVYPEALLDIPD